MTDQNRYEWNEKDPAEIYDKKTDIFYPLKRTMGSGGFLYENFVGGGYVAVNKSYSTKTWEIDDNTKEYREWYGTDLAVGGYIVETIPASLRSVYEYLRDNLPKDLIDEYFTISGGLSSDDNNRPFPQEYNWLSVFPVTGGSEGHYIHIEVINGEKRELLFLAKTFRGMDHAWEISKQIGRLLNV